MTAFFTSDTHFSGKRTLELSKRPFKDINEMDSAIIENWNSKVTNDDTVYHLGDFGEPGMIRLLYGKEIFFLPGITYDTKEVIDELKHLDERIHIIRRNEVVLYGGKNYVLVHEPETAKSNYTFFLYGHIHKLQMVKRNGLCVSQDAHHFCPISLEEVEFYRNAIENFYDENVFIEKL